MCDRSNPLHNNVEFRGREDVREGAVETNTRSVLLWTQRLDIYSGLVVFAFSEVTSIMELRQQTLSPNPSQQKKERE